ncbi:MAG: DUF507 family protein [Nitrospirota bacterium]|nr:DUF507 family protein [Nitrospirota bacterium]
MILSDEKISHLSHLIAREIKKEVGTHLLVDDPELLKGVKKIVNGQLKLFSEIDHFARNKIQTYSRKIPEGSREWDVMYQKILGEEMAKRTRSY